MTQSISLLKNRTKPFKNEKPGLLDPTRLRAVKAGEDV
jgi:hypothetical protein